MGNIQNQCFNLKLKSNSPLIKKPRKKSGKHEELMQVACVNWFRSEYGKYYGYNTKYLCFAVPNGGSRNKIEAVNLRNQGVTSGVSDLIIPIPNANYHGAFCELKVKPNVQEDNQKEFQAVIEKQGYAYFLIWTTDEFIKTVTEYMKTRKI